MDKVDIFLVDNNYGTPFLSIPKRDIQRLSLYPHKWMRFLLFAICGAHGQLSATLKGPAVEGDTGFTDLCAAYYYAPYGVALFFVTLLPLTCLHREPATTFRRPQCPGCDDHADFGNSANFTPE